MSLFKLRNEHGLEVRLTDRGGIVVSLLAPDRDGRLGDIVLGFDSPADYDRNPAYFGALIGRYANRIARARFELDGEVCSLAANEPPHHLHGGVRGFDAVTWDAERVTDDAGDGLILRYTSADGEEGYPGTLEARVRYTLTADDELVVDYQAVTDRATPVNLTQHSYFNLAGHAAGDILGHVLTLGADAFTPVDRTLIPTGEIRQVAGTPFDFREPTPIGARLHDHDEQLRIGGGYDHNFVLDPPETDGLRFAARVHEPVSGRVLEVRTSEPGMQLYSGNGLDGSLVGKGGARYGPRAGLALETQHYPDSPNQPTFPSTIVRPGATYRSRTSYRFTTE